MTKQITDAAVGLEHVDGAVRALGFAMSVFGVATDIAIIHRGGCRFEVVADLPNAFRGISVGLKPVL